MPTLSQFQSPSNVYTLKNNEEGNKMKKGRPRLENFLPNNEGYGMWNYQRSEKVDIRQSNRGEKLRQNSFRTEW